MPPSVGSVAVHGSGVTGAGSIYIGNLKSKGLSFKCIELRVIVIGIKLVSCAIKTTVAANRECNNPFEHRTRGTPDRCYQMRAEGEVPTQSDEIPTQKQSIASDLSEQKKCFMRFINTLRDVGPVTRVSHNVCQ